MLDEARHWAETQFGTADLGDARRTHRLVTQLGHLRRGFHGESTDFPDILADFGVISTEVWCHATEPFSLFSQVELLISWCPGEGAVFFRIKQSGPRSYLQIVANQREGGAVRQKVIATLGRTDELAASGGLASLLASGARHCEQVLLLSTLQADLEGPRVLAKRIGAPLLFGRLWEEAGCRAVIEDLLAERRFEFPVERAVFATVGA